MKLNHTDLDEREGDQGNQPARLALSISLTHSRYDMSVSASYQIYYCQPREPCKEHFREEFMCRSASGIRVKVP
jgi:hypothetical protein